MSLLLGIDLGTSYFKVGLFDVTGELRGLGRVAVEKHSPAPGRAELAVETFWQLLRDGLSQALGEAQASPADIVAMSYASQANTFVLLDATGAPLTPLILWTDARAEPTDEEWIAFTRQDVFSRTVGFADFSGMFAPAKWRWYQRHQSHLWSRVRHIMTVSDYFTYVLTGRRNGDASTAAFLGLYDLGGQCWWPEALSMSNVEAEQLSRPLLPGTPCARTSAAAETYLGLPAGVAFAVGALDHHSAAMGAGLSQFADVSISTGTVLAALALVNSVAPSARCFHGPHTDGKRFYRLAFHAEGAGQLEDYQRRFAPNIEMDELLGLAKETPPEPDHAAPDRSRTDHGRAVRDLLQRAAKVQRGLVEAVAGAAPVRHVTATGGGARSPLWLQIQADCLEAPVITTQCVEQACLGAAVFAGAAAELFPDIPAAARAMVRESHSYAPGARGPT